jgi:hypothetical protein
MLTGIAVSCGVVNERSSAEKTQCRLFLAEIQMNVVDRLVSTIVICGLSMSIVACTRGLTHDRATAVIVANKLIRATDNVSVEALSESSATETIVRATIAGEEVNLKFRKFDKGWTWEFVETATGGWVAPDVAIGQIREEHRTSAAAKWAAQRAEGYRSTAMTISLMALYDVPNPAQRQDLVAWKRFRGSLVDMFKRRQDMKEEDRSARLRVLTGDRQIDAWGGEIDTTADTNSGAAVVSSAGPDKVKGNEDDILCESTFGRGFEDGRVIWEQHKRWSVPEDLGDAVMNEFFDKSTDRVEFTEVIKP